MNRLFGPVFADDSDTSSDNDSSDGSEDSWGNDGWDDGAASDQENIPD